MGSENKLKHLEFIQSVINRMASNSFLLKGWGVTLVAGLSALAAKDANPKYVVVAYLPVAMFWVIDAYFLSQERSFRALYDEIRKKQDAEIDFSMDARAFCTAKHAWSQSFFARTLLLFYGSLVVGMLAIMYLIG